jgi:choice-of-anchor A domain-containing protein
MRIRSAAIGLVFILASCPRAGAGSLSLGDALNFNVYVSGNMTQSGGDSWGAVAVGGSATIKNATIAGTNQTNPAGDSLVIGGALSYTQGEIGNGNVRVGTTVTLGSSDNSAVNGGTLYYGSTTGNTFPKHPHFNYTNLANGGIASDFFSSTNAALTHASSILSQQATNGTVTFQYGTMTLTGTHSDIDYFQLSGSQLKQTTNLLIDAPKGATVVVNVDGTTDQFSGAGMTFKGISASDLLFNFYQANSLTLSGLALDASLLAPAATLYGSSGQIDGNVMVAGIMATKGFEYHDSARFLGNLLVASIPEPSSLVLVAIGVVIMGGYTWRRRAVTSHIVP